MESEDLAELLLELKHDLGKHMLLPVSMLPADATAADLREALAAGLRATRPGPQGHRSARRLWRDFRAELGEIEFPGLHDIEVVVERALAWERALEDLERPLERAAVVADLRAVGETIGIALRGVRVDRDGA